MWDVKDSFPAMQVFKEAEDRKAVVDMFSAKGEAKAPSIGWLSISGKCAVVESCAVDG